MQSLTKMIRMNSLMKQTQQLARPFAKRTFSAQMKPPEVNNTGAYILLGLGAMGMGYVGYQSLQLNNARSSGYMEPGQTFMDKAVQQRIAATLGYFGYGVGATGIFTYAMRNSARLGSINPFLLFGLSIGTLIGCHSLDYQHAFLPKVALYTAFIGLQSATLVPLINMTAVPILFDAALGTGLMMSGLASVAYMAPSEQFLMWGGALSMGCMGMMGVGLMSMFFPSKHLFNIWLYGGLALSGALVLYRTQKLIHDAKQQPRFDPINHGIGFYLDALNIFVRLVIMLSNNKK